MSYPHYSNECDERHDLVADGPAARVLRDVQDERTRQNEKWNEQNHTDGTGGEEWSWAAILDLVENRSVDNDAAAAAAKRETDAKAQRGMVTWADILLEEVAEAFAENDPAHLRAELVQVAAVAAQWVEAIDRRVRA